MEADLIKKIYDNYGITIKNIQTLSGGWMNKKYLIQDKNNVKYVIKLFSSKKVEKMSNNEFSSDYLDNQTINNLNIENYMHNNKLNCEKVFLTYNNQLMLKYKEYRVAVMSFLNGKYVAREDISNIQLYNLGRECAKMHILFENVDDAPYIGEYLKIPSIDTLFYRYETKISNHEKGDNKSYLDLVYKQKQNLLLLKETNIIDDIPVCITHGDFADDNILFYENTPQILDFELVRLNSYLLDIGRILMSYCFEENFLNYEKIKFFSDGYNSVKELNEKDILLSFITVWINEVDMWIKKNYFNKEITKKAKRFQEELVYLTNNLPKIINFYYEEKEELKKYCITC